MAGHSKFKNIMHRKGAQDAKRAKVFNRCAKEITIAVKEGGSDDPGMNPRLRLAIQNARAENMPKDKIEAAIKKGAGNTDGDNYEEMRYEGYGPGGVAILVEVLTDNKNRSAAEVRAAFSKHGGNLGESGSVSFMFDRVGIFTYPLEAGSEEEMLEAAIEAGAENCETTEEHHEITCEHTEFSSVRDALQDSVGEPKSGKLAWVPKSSTPIDESQAATLFKLIDALEDNDDVQEVCANFDVSDEILEKLSA
ncbi:MAG: YebC/PmpR family DNA-binding transcriptional regulator [Rickettsiales bacterium]|nr:YebC/PmpR family DNA-binding transcriptional regulator [Rickettsiales bacterium]